LAEKFHLPVMTFIDTPGANPILEAEERGQGLQIAVNLQEMARLKTPVIVTIIGEGCSGGALGIGIGDLILMLEHSYYSVISPEGCASILYKDASKKIESATALKLTAPDLLKFGIIDAIINEPLGGAHHDPQAVFAHLKKVLSEEMGPLRLLSTEVLIERRYQKFRKMGELFSPS
jgi:acetyl-CoA carboxylase carboxyl transferase subunit alpha